MPRYKKPGTIYLYTSDTRDFFKKHQIKFVSFKDKEMKYYIPAPGKSDRNTNAIDRYDGKEVIIFDRMYPEPQKRFFTIANIISDLSFHTDKIALVVPYFPFLRQDHDSSDTDVYKHHEGKTAWVSLRLLGQLGLTYLITLDGHCFKGPGVFTTDPDFRRFPKHTKGKRKGEEIEEFGIIPPKLKIINLSMAPELHRKVRFVAKRYGYEKVLFMSPDLGASYMTKVHPKDDVDISEDEKHLDKERGEDTCEGVVEITEIKGRITREKIQKYDALCFIDDMVASGGTILDSISYLRDLGVKFTPYTNEFENPPKGTVDLMLAVTHWQGLEGAMNKLSSAGISDKRIVVSNSIVENNMPLASGNAVRVQEKLERVVAMITFDKAKDITDMKKLCADGMDIETD